MVRKQQNKNRRFDIQISMSNLDYGFLIPLFLLMIASWFFLFYAEKAFEESWE